jgi:hypothetical protein
MDISARAREFAALFFHKSSFLVEFVTILLLNHVSLYILSMLSKNIVYFSSIYF